jgi:hypothetical protein
MYIFFEVSFFKTINILALCPNSIVGDAYRLSAVSQQSRSFGIGVASASRTWVLVGISAVAKH